MGLGKHETPKKGLKSFEILFALSVRWFESLSAFLIHVQLMENSLAMVKLSFNDSLQKL